MLPLSFPKIKLPKKTSISSSQRRPSKPSGRSADRRGGGPPSNLRAEVKVLQGVPQCKKKTIPSAKICKSCCQKWQSTRSRGVGTIGDGTISTGGRTGTPANWQMHCLREASPTCKELQKEWARAEQAVAITQKLCPNLAAAAENQAPLSDQRRKPPDHHSWGWWQPPSSQVEDQAPPGREPEAISGCRAKSGSAHTRHSYA